MRHADVENPKGLVYGSQLGFPLSELGKNQVQQAVSFLSDVPLSLIISSPMERALETATMMSSAKSAPVVSEALLGETVLGKLEGNITKAEFYANRDKYQAAQIAEEDGMESPSTIQKRMRAAFDKYLEEHPEGNLLFVSHGAPICFLLQSLLGQPAAFTDGEIYPTKGAIVEINFSNPLSFKTIFEPDN